MKNQLMSRIYCGKESFIPDENDVILWNGVVYQVLTRFRSANGWDKIPLRLSKTNANLFIRKGVLKTNERFTTEQKMNRRMISTNLTFYYFDMERFKELT